MTKEKMTVESSDIEKRISEEYERLEEIFSSIPEKQLETVRPLMKNVSFLSVTLERLQESINSGEVTEEYQNGAGQFGRKTSSELQTFNNLIKDYTSIISKLLKLLPVESQKRNNKLETFIRSVEEAFEMDED